MAILAGKSAQNARFPCNKCKRILQKTSRAGMYPSNLHFTADRSVKCGKFCNFLKDAVNAAMCVTSVNEIWDIRMIHSVPRIGGIYGLKCHNEGIIS